MAILHFPALSTNKLLERCSDTLRANWHLGFTCFGGPPVHFKIFHDRFVKKLEWVNDEVYQELFSVCQAFSGPASTKMLYCINLLHGGFVPALLSFVLWSLPGALGMFGLGMGVARLGAALPGPAYAVLSGLNAATVGIVALAAVELSQKVITDRLTRLLVFLGAAAGLLYNALWYFPVVLAAAGLIALVHDYRWLHPPALALRRLVRRFPRRTTGPEDVAELARPMSPVGPIAGADAPLATAPPEPRVVPPGRQLGLSWKVGLAIIGGFFVTFAVVMAVRSAVPSQGLLYRLFANMYLAGTIIFGGGPVVIPLLREYVVAEGWVSPRDFLIGLALIQGFPGPNFNFAVYLGALTAAHGGHAPLVGAVLAALAIFLPGLVLVHGGMGIWGSVRGWRGVRSTIRGLNSAAVGFIYTAVYRLWQIGWIEQDFQQGTSLANDPWWVVVTATSYVGGCWFGLKPPAAMIVGATLGLVRYGVVTA